MKNIALLIVLALLLTACGFSGNRPNDPGYADLNLPGWSEADRVLYISFGPAIFRMVRWITDEDQDPEAEALLKNVRAVRIAIYELEGDNPRLRKHAADSSQYLQKQGWEVLVKVNEGTEQTLVMSKIVGQRMTGIMVLSVDEEEMVFVNLMGSIDPAQLSDILRGLDSEIEADLDIQLPDTIEVAEGNQVT
ncbi:MAG: DUF4252 domain-containing protein [Xanthomonadales bacterium]|nr:DUF4252 domain-containing protein [Xanthomonadales bacterium]